MLKKRSFYLFSSLGLLSSYVWIWFVHTYETTSIQSICIFKNTMRIPCPACGSTRSTILILSGDFYLGFLTNPVGILISLIMLAAPCIMMWDYIKKDEKGWKMYNNIEYMLKKKRIIFPLIILIGLNWIWNIIKGL